MSPWLKSHRDRSPSQGRLHTFHWDLTSAMPQTPEEPDGSLGVKYEPTSICIQTTSQKKH